jgi:hypothetical protein
MTGSLLLERLDVGNVRRTGRGMGADGMHVLRGVEDGHGDPS